MERKAALYTDDEQGNCELSWVLYHLGMTFGSNNDSFSKISQRATMTEKNTS